MKTTNPELKKGAWTEEEDALLRNCIERHGEGKWHLIPFRTGLNRCRRSCRLRWLNYLKPNIKRGEFEDDEVDLVIRLHNLLGNRWSLIAGRIPGRTANDVKNYWNTRLARKVVAENKKSRCRTKGVPIVKVIKPHPRTFSRTASWVRGTATLITCPALRLYNHDINLEDKCTSPPPETEAGAAWWEGLSGDMADLDRAHTFGCLQGVSLVGELLAETSKTTVEGSLVRDDEGDVISFDIDLWQHSDTTPQPVA
ncbi:hypothetical protein MLD38_034659 [Melastoma candidum]|uniref:Uncharacterized protein n=1 Tax=Melastoma candidum TaxID=119954 RepID=A0ACB9MEM2_9MYRT|nr:hypothetical protein MLD38_034659 [Melastoma candidum]